MFNCQCGKPVRAIYCPDENQHEPDDVCQDCHDEAEFKYHVEQAFILQQRREIKKHLQELDKEDDLPF